VQAAQQRISAYLPPLVRFDIGFYDRLTKRPLYSFRNFRAYCSFSNSKTRKPKATSRMALTLAFTKRYFGFGDKDDQVVLDGARVIGATVILRPHSAISRTKFFK
jgi:hypothetical protein